jgi:hypothetical protein
MNLHAMWQRTVLGLAVTAGLATLAPAASASIGTPAVTLTPATGKAAATANLGTDIKFSPSSGDTTKDLTLALPAGLLANAGIDKGACLKSATPVAACQVGSGTVTATASVFGLPVQMTLTATFDLVAPPNSADLAGLAVLVTDPVSGKPTQLGTPAAITIRPAADPAGVGLDIAFKNIPKTFDNLSISLNEINSTFAGLRFPSSCPATPADVTVSADSYGDSTIRTGRAPLTVTGCGSLPYSPAFTATVVRDSGDSEVQVSTDITQTADQATSKSVSLAFPTSVLVPNLGVTGALCSSATLAGCTPIGSSRAVSPLYPTPLTGKAYLTGSFTAPAITLAFGPPFSLTLTGAVDLGSNSTRFSGIPDFPLSDLQVSLNGGSHAVFETSCTNSSGNATATLTSQNGDQTKSVSAPFTVSGCTKPPGGGTGQPPRGGTGQPPTSTTGKPQIHAASMSGLATGKPSLVFQLVAGNKGPKLRSFTIELPSGLRFVRHRVGKRLTVSGISLRGGKLKSIALRHGHLVITLRAAVASVTVDVSPRALGESTGLRSRAKHHKLKSLKLIVLIRDAKGKVTRVTLQIRSLHLPSVPSHDAGS